MVEDEDTQISPAPFPEEGAEEALGTAERQRNTPPVTDGSRFQSEALETPDRPDARGSKGPSLGHRYESLLLAVGAGKGRYLLLGVLLALSLLVGVVVAVVVATY